MGDDMKVAGLGVHCLAQNCQICKTPIPKTLSTDEAMASLWNGSFFRVCGWLGLACWLRLDPATGAQDDRQVRQDALTRENVMLRTVTSRSAGSVAASHC